MDAAGDVIRRKVSRGSGLWRPLSRTFWTCRAVLAFCRRSVDAAAVDLARVGVQSVAGELSATTDDFFVIQIGACDGLMATPSTTGSRAPTGGESWWSRKSSSSRSSKIPIDRSRIV